ncbi:hypothetical protein PPACK8108_LOCUS13147 [Phakopsora pachyrhizi]|uniref:Uncharacterized protein n=1 Tax=Phakopsora pachyrhizi TaxID=170000 RepID=A0AAV0B352_PHAPC|nr:hypothetical protein PPACK8108_LOCUS13147 [Phakopsora pachyrhizi]
MPDYYEKLFFCGEDEENEVKRGFGWIFLGFEDEEVALEGNRWHQREEEETLSMDL